jgi:hypothetical protein
VQKGRQLGFAPLAERCRSAVVHLVADRNNRSMAQEKLASIATSDVAIGIHFPHCAHLPEQLRGPLKIDAE